MNITVLGEACFQSPLKNRISDQIRIPEQIEIGVDPGLQFELADPTDTAQKQVRSGVAPCLECRLQTATLFRIVESLGYARSTALPSLDASLLSSSEVHPCQISLVKRTR